MAFNPRGRDSRLVDILKTNPFSSHFGAAVSDIEAEEEQPYEPEPAKVDETSQIDMTAKEAKFFEDLVQKIKEALQPDFAAGKDHTTQTVAASTRRIERKMSTEFASLRADLGLPKKNNPSTPGV